MFVFVQVIISAGRAEVNRVGDLFRVCSRNRVEISYFTPPNNRHTDQRLWVSALEGGQPGLEGPGNGEPGSSFLCAEITGFSPPGRT